MVESEEMTSPDELKQVVAGCKAGCNESFSRLIDMFAGPCYGYFCRLSGDRDVSDELLSELFMRVVEKIGSYRGGSFEKWIFVTASNIFHDWLRMKRRRQQLAEAARDFAAERRGEDRAKDADADEVGEKLMRLDEETRELIVLRFYSGMSFREMGEARGLPIGTVLSKVHRGLRKLRELMEQE
ncbi:MAG: sigma-70 family RNA polymerase sigma factor [Planctomycetota bacterium]